MADFKNLRDILAKNYETVESALIELAPKGQTRRLKKSIEVNPKGTISMIYYGQFVNDGTRYITPRRFVEKGIKRVFDASEDDISKALEEDIYNAIKP